MRGSHLARLSNVTSLASFRPVPLVGLARPRQAHRVCSPPGGSRPSTAGPPSVLSTEKLYVQETPGITDVHVTEENGAPHLQVRANVLCVFVCS